MKKLIPTVVSFVLLAAMYFLSAFSTAHAVSYEEAVRQGTKNKIQEAAEMAANVYEPAVRAGILVKEVDDRYAGSGVLISPDRALTAAHVIADPDASHFIVFHGDKVMNVEVVQRGEPKSATDYAFLSLPFPVNVDMRIRCTPLHLGESVFAVSSPGPYKNLLTFGKVMQLESHVHGTVGIYMDIGWGSSGGVVYDLSGALVGLVIAKAWLPEGALPHQTFIIPSADIGAGEEALCLR